MTDPTVRRFTTPSGLTVVGDDYGPGSRPPVLLLHGGGQTRHAWGGTAEVLSDHGFHVVSLDARGHGDSDWSPEGDYSHQAMIDDLVCVADVVADEAGGVRPALVGASMGGIISLLGLARRPDLGRALVLVDVATRMEEEGVGKIQAFMRGAPNGFASVEEAADAVAAYQPHRPRPKNVSGLRKNLRLREDGRWYWHWDPEFINPEGKSPRATRNPDLLDAAAASLTVPVLLVRGRMSDVLSDEGARFFLAQVPHARYVDVAGAAHMVAGDRNDAFTSAVVDFLDPSGGEPSGEKLMLDAGAVERHVAATWDGEIVPILHDYIRIPAKSPHYDEQWAEHGHIDAAAELFRQWAAARPIDGMSVEVVRLPGRTPVLLCEIPPAGGSTTDGTVLLYGHLDKQPEMVGWDDGKGPWEPVLDAGRLYGRGGADDGYALFASLAAVEAVHQAGGSHGRLMVLIEASEESGSPDLPAHVDQLADRLGLVDLVVCLDSSCGTYDTLWVTTSLRGLVGGILSVDVVREGLHSGAFGGVVPSSFRIARQLLSRVEDESTGEIRLEELHVPIPDERRRQIADVATELGASIVEEVPWAGSTRPLRDDVAEILLDKAWRPVLTVTGFDGAPRPADAGNVLVPGTRLAVSVRIPPTCDPAAAGEALRSALEADPPQGADVRFELGHTAGGWEAPATAPWLTAALDSASEAAFGRPARYQGEGGSIPFMGMLGERFPQAQFVITGVLGPGSNAHGPNEFLDVAMGRGVTAAVAHLLDAHVTR